MSDRPLATARESVWHAAQFRRNWGAKLIWIETPPDTVPTGKAVRDRLQRAGLKRSLADLPGKDTNFLFVFFIRHLL